MKELANLAIQAAMDQGAQYVEVRFEETEEEHLVVKNGLVEESQQKYCLGYGIRVLWNGAWGFAASFSLDKEAIARTARQAVAIAKGSARVRNQSLQLAPNSAYQDSWRGSWQIDPRTVSLQDKIDYLLQCDQTMQAVKGITICESFMEFVQIHKWFASSEGSWIEQEIPVSGVGIAATAIRDDELQTRSYPNSFFGQYEGIGYEIVDRWKPREHAERIAHEAVALLDAPPCPQGVKTLIIDSTQMALQIHESCGHAVELDRVLGSEINDYGSSFLTLDKLSSSYRYASPRVTIVADPLHPGGLGTYAYDDEGVPAKKTYLVQEGIFRNYLTSRETAASIGQDESNGSMRAENYNRIPLIRMTNINLEPGHTPLAEMIGETEDGLFIAVNRSFSIDDRRWQFQFGTEIGWLIKRGKLRQMVKNPIYNGITPHFWQSCDAIAPAEEWILWGVPGCGKGQPDQGARVSHGCSPTRFQDVQVGSIRG
ncbi:TldD/PmbA family protein [candidate division CSSED10-310 bacterium]|uniref:TldD/PmbA family protein n=1 Tax=candidate division CSSED10-310 bacterium TaxID=2855610 RepID=A0ABV6YTS9_UNCC1